MDNLPITVGIPTKDRYNALNLCLLSIVNQTSKPSEIIIVDDSDNRIDVREDINFRYIMELAMYYGIQWRVIYKEEKGQVLSHAIIQSEAKYDYVFRIDDDCIAEPNVLDELWRFAENTTNFGAIGCSILMPNPQLLPKGLPYNSVNNINSPNIQWFIWDGWNEVDHINSSFLYKKGIVEYNRNLSRVGHREETIFTHEIKRAGYKIYATGHARIWHFRQPSGGIRSYPDPSLYERDNQIFEQLLKSWNYFDPIYEKLVVLDNGLGDHYAFLHILSDLKKRYAKIVIAACYNDVFFEHPDVELISIAEAKLILGDITRYDIYTWMASRNHTGNLVEAFKQMYA